MLIQTLRPEHPLFQMLLEKDYRYFAQHTLKERQLAQFPPFRYSMLVRSQARNENLSDEKLRLNGDSLQAITLKSGDQFPPRGNAKEM